MVEAILFVVSAFTIVALTGHFLIRLMFRFIQWPVGRTVAASLLRAAFYSPTLAVGEGGAAPVPTVVGMAQWWGHLRDVPLYFLAPAAAVFSISIIAACFGLGVRSGVPVAASQRGLADEQRP